MNHQTLIERYDKTINVVWQPLYYMLHTTALDEAAKSTIKHLIAHMEEADKWLKNYKKELTNE